METRATATRPNATTITSPNFWTAPVIRSTLLTTSRGFLISFLPVSSTLTSGRDSMRWATVLLYLGSVIRTLNSAGRGLPSISSRSDFSSLYIFLNSASASSLEMYLTLFTSGIFWMNDCMLERSSTVTLSLSNTRTSSTRSFMLVASPLPAWTDMPTTPSIRRERLVTITAAAVRAMLRFMDEPDSFRKYMKLTAIAVHPPGLVADDTPVAELDNPLLEGVDDILVVGCHDHRGARVVDSFEELDDSYRHRRVEVTGGFVRQEYGRTVHKRAGNGHPLLFATGHLVGIRLEFMAQADQPEDLGDVRLDYAARPARHFEGVGHVLVDRLVGQELVVLEHATDLAPEVRYLPFLYLGQVRIGDIDLAAGRLILFEHKLYERGLARPAGADQEHELFCLDINGHVVQGVYVALVHL